MTDSPTRPAPLAVGDTMNDLEATAALDAYMPMWRSQNNQPMWKSVANMRCALDAAAAYRRAQPALGLADLSLVPKDIYVVSVSTHDGIVYDVTCCSVPMAIGPEVRYTRAEKEIIDPDGTLRVFANITNDEAKAKLCEILDQQMGREDWTSSAPVAETEKE